MASVTILNPDFACLQVGNILVGVAVIQRCSKVPWGRKVTQIDYGKHEQTVKELDRQEKEQEYERDLVENFVWRFLQMPELREERAQKQQVSSHLAAS